MENTWEYVIPTLSLEDQKKRNELREAISVYYQTIPLYELMREEVEAFEIKYPECRNYILFHDLIGSTPTKDITKFDMPNNEIENLIIHGLDKYQRHEEKKAA